MEQRGFSISYRSNSNNNNCVVAVFSSNLDTFPVSIIVEIHFDCISSRDFRIQYICPNMNTLSTGWASGFFNDKQFSRLQNGLLRQAVAISEL